MSLHRRKKSVSNTNTRPLTSLNTTYNGSFTGREVLRQGLIPLENYDKFKIIKELDNEDISAQEALIENERLRTTCVSLNNKL